MNEAYNKFIEIYQKKTGNNFGNIDFFKHPNKYYHLDIEHGPSAQTILNQIPKTTKTMLSPAVYDFIQMIFDVKQIENLINSCNLDLKQMPLGKISAKQINLAMTALQEISLLITGNGKLSQLREACNRFYTLIPHGFCANRPEIIDSIQTVTEKSEMLQSLLNLDLIYEYLDGNNGKINPFDAYYRRLKVNIAEVPHNSVLFEDICHIVQNTHGHTHNEYKLEVLELFKVERDGEDERFKKYQDVNNHQLLWHGTRLTNFVSILSSGLKIAPPEVPHTGYMFGKGIYFADIVSKAANYCRTDRTNNVGLLLLCEVALGLTFNLYEANTDIRNINHMLDSVKACGAMYPLEQKIIDDLTVWSGRLTRAQYQTSLHYNEFVVYDPAQVKIKYLVKLKFNYS